MFAMVRLERIGTQTTGTIFEGYVITGLLFPILIVTDRVGRVGVEMVWRVV